MPRRKGHLLPDYATILCRYSGAVNARSGCQVASAVAADIGRRADNNGDVLKTGISSRLWRRPFPHWSASRQIQHGGRRDCGNIIQFGAADRPGCDDDVIIAA